MQTKSIEQLICEHNSLIDNLSKIGFYSQYPDDDERRKEFDNQMNNEFATKELNRLYKHTYENYGGCISDLLKTNYRTIGFVFHNMDLKTVRTESHTMFAQFSPSERLDFVSNSLQKFQDISTCLLGRYVQVKSPPTKCTDITKEKIEEYLRLIDFIYNHLDKVSYDVLSNYIECLIRCDDKIKYDSNCPSGVLACVELSEVFLNSYYEC